MLSRQIYIGVGVTSILVAIGFIVVLDNDESNPKTEAESIKYKSSRITVTQDDSLRKVQEKIELLDKVAREKLKLSFFELDDLLSCLEFGRPKGCEKGIWQHFVNSSLNALNANLERNNDDEISLRVTQLLHKMALKSDDEVIRNYAVQQISFLFEYSIDKPLLLKTLKKASELATDNAGTAVTVMSDLLQKGLISEDDISVELLSLKSLELASDESAANDVRISAIHTCVNRKETKILPLAEELGVDEKQHMTLRKAAVYAIGQLGNREQHDELLKGISTSEARLESAADYALKNLSTKENP